MHGPHIYGLQIAQLNIHYETEIGVAAYLTKLMQVIYVNNLWRNITDHNIHNVQNTTLNYSTYAE